MDQRFAARGSHAEVEEGLVLAPKFDAAGLIACITTDADSGQVVMFAHMNADALALTIETGVAHYWSRSRSALWRKGETSGHEQTVVSMRVDCDQDAIWIAVRTAGTGANCHTGRKGCFYREVPLGGPVESGLALRPVDDTVLFDPAKVYGG
jgi:phosphoribosyl-AMP cyclohydrolase